MRARKLIIWACYLSLAGFLVFMAAACGSSGNKPNAYSQNQNASSSRAATYARAQAQVPAPIVKNFPRRQTLADAVERQSEPDHPWYVYVLGQNGNIVNYFVAKSVPVNDCDYLSSAQSVIYDSNGNIVLQSPSLEGIYQADSGCNTLTFFDLSSNAEVQITAIGTYISDHPLKVNAQAIKIKK